MDEFFGIARQFGITASELQACARALEGHRVTDVHGLHDGFQFVKTIGALAKDVQDEVDLAG
jgi:hypothetical protein